jgi:hypothetical protein
MLWIDMRLSLGPITVQMFPARLTRAPDAPEVSRFCNKELASSMVSITMFNQL